MLIKIFKFVFILLLYQSPLYSKTKTLNDFNSRYLSNYFSGIVTSIIFSGTNTRYKIKIKDTVLESSVQSVGKKEISENDEVFIHLPEEKIWGMND